MPRRAGSDLMKDWKVPLPATLAGAVEFELMDPLTHKPRYGERSRLIAALLSDWLARRGRIVPIDEMPAPDLYTKDTSNAGPATANANTSTSPGNTGG